MATRGKNKPAHARAKLEQAAAIEKVGDKVEDAHLRIDALTTRLDRIEGALSALSTKVSELEKRVDGRVTPDGLSGAITDAVGKLRNAQDDAMASLRNALGVVSSRVDAMDQGLRSAVAPTLSAPPTGGNAA